jgi:hypothetical protein
MSHRPTLPTHLRTTSSISSAAAGNPSNQSTSALMARVAEKKAELASLKELQRLSAAVADQMSMLEEKLGTLADGTEGMFCVGHERDVEILERWLIWICSSRLGFGELVKCFAGDSFG